MFKMSKKTLIALTVGTIISSSTAFPIFTKVANANDQMMPPPPIQGEMQKNNKRDHRMPPQDDRRMFFPEIEQELGISKTTMDSYCQNGYQPGDVVAAALIAKTARTSLNDIMNYKSQKNSWKDTMEKYNITFEQIVQTRNELSARVIAKHTGANKIVIDRLFKEGYRDHDIIMAAELAKLSSKSVIQVINMKKINNTWRDVVKSLNIDENVIRKDMGPVYQNKHE